MTHCMNLGTPNYKDGAETVSLCEMENADLSSDLTASALPDKKGLRFMRRPFLFHGTKENPRHAERAGVGTAVETARA